VHRVGQVVAHVRARVEPEEEELVRRVLPSDGVRLFAWMPLADRRHGLDVAEALLRSGRDDPELLAAALLHDAAKGHRMRLWHRVAGVLLEAGAPWLIRRLASDDRRSWRYPFHLHLHHAPMSAELAVRAGCAERVGDLIRGTPTSDADRELHRALEAADDAS
jgi:hypothetical protein